MSWSCLQIEEGLRKRIAERYRSIDGEALRKLAAAGLEWLRTNQKTVNNLNVFPIPDGDTGTNMVLTMQSAIDEIPSSEEPSIGKLAHVIAHGALMGARGNSGVILSQLWRGFARALDDCSVMNAGLLAEGLAEARDTAYKGVVRPVEGTILTVSKDIAAAAETAVDQGVATTVEILEIVVQAAHESVERTPELLPVLKEAGVVDSGGLGLYFILEGMLRWLYRQPLDTPMTVVESPDILMFESSADIIEPGQDWEVVVDFRPEPSLNFASFHEQLETLGTSIQLGEGDGIYRLHIHVPDEEQFKPIQFVQGHGTVTKVAIENLRDQMAEQAASEPEDIKLAAVEPDHVAAVVVSPGKGISRVLASLGAAAIVEGGQTMNPSTKEILAAVEGLPTDNVIILPNNKNILLAARQAVELTGKNVGVVPSVSIPQGIASMLALNAEAPFPEVLELMTSSIQDIQSGELTVATRSVELDGVKVKKGQVIGLLDGQLAVAGDSLGSTLISLIEKAVTEQSELITLYYGSDVDQERAAQYAEKVRERWPDLEVELIAGGQPHYHLILSIE